jgi:hypothetical protein
MVSKTKTRTNKKGKQTKASKKSKSTPKKKVGGKKTSSKRIHGRVTRPKTVTPSKRKRRTTSRVSSTSTGLVGGDKSLSEESVPSSLNETTSTTGVRASSEATRAEVGDNELMTSTFENEDKDVEQDSGTSRALS